MRFTLGKLICMGQCHSARLQIYDFYSSSSQPLVLSIAFSHPL
jgi:hypothetical protein